MRNNNKYMDELFSLYCNSDLSIKEEIVFQLIEHLSKSLNYQESVEQCESVPTQEALKS